jgi:hypothetical protein
MHIYVNMHACNIHTHVHTCMHTQDNAAPGPQQRCMSSSSAGASVTQGASSCITTTHHNISCNTINMRCSHSDSSPRQRSSILGLGRLSVGSWLGTCPSVWRRINTMTPATRFIFPEAGNTDLSRVLPSVWRQIRAMTPGIRSLFSRAGMRDFSRGCSSLWSSIPGIQIPGTQIPGTKIPVTRIPGTWIPGARFVVSAAVSQKTREDFCDVFTGR